MGGVASEHLASILDKRPFIGGDAGDGGRDLGIRQLANGSGHCVRPRSVSTPRARRLEKHHVHCIGVKVVGVVLSNKSSQRNVTYRARLVLAMDCALAEAERLLWPSAERNR